MKRLVSKSIFYSILIAIDAAMLVVIYGMAVKNKVVSDYFYQVFDIRLVIKSPLNFFLEIPKPFEDNYGAYFYLLPFVIICAIPCFAYFRLYNFRGEISITNDLVNSIKASFIYILLLVACAFWYRGGFKFRGFTYSREIFLQTWLGTFFAVFFLRVIYRLMQLYLRKKDYNTYNILVVGCDELAWNFTEEISNKKTKLGVRIVGMVAGDDHDQSEDKPSVLGSLEQLPDIIRKNKVSEVIFTIPVFAERLIDLMMQLEDSNVSFKTILEIYDYIPEKISLDHLGGFPVIKHFGNPIKGLNRFIKRTTDLVLSSIGLILLSWLFILIALLIKLTSKGPVLFKQKRVGRDGRIFKCLKFRTMFITADQETHKDFVSRLIKGEMPSDPENKQVYKLKEDHRITPIGRFLRKYSLDELPQLINVIKGEMSLVGPRPAIPYEIVNYKPWHKRRLTVDQGITGLWQVSGRSRLTFDQMVELDIFYIDNWSVWLDLKIILWTLYEVFIARNAY